MNFRKIFIRVIFIVIDMKKKTQKKAMTIFGISLMVGSVLGMIFTENVWLFFLGALVGAVLYGGTPDWKSIVKQWKVSSGILFASLIVAIFYIQYYGWNAFLTTFIDAMFYALIISTFVYGTVKKIFRD